VVVHVPSWRHKNLPLFVLRAAAAAEFIESTLKSKLSFHALSGANSPNNASSVRGNPAASATFIWNADGSVALPLSDCSLFTPSRVRAAPRIIVVW